MKFRRWARRAILLGLGLAAWQFASEGSAFVALLISSPSRLAQYAQTNWQALGLDLVHTVSVAGFSLLLAIVIGGLVACLALLRESAARSIQALSTVAQSIPLVVFAPFAIMLFGVGYVSQVILGTIMAIFSIIVGFAASYRGAREEFRELAILFNLSFFERVRELYIPFATPGLIASARIAAGLALLGAVIAEFTGSTIGLGHDVFLGTVRLDPELMMSSLILTALLGLLSHGVLQYLEDRSARWRM